jgi:hypothetical protein
MYFDNWSMPEPTQLLQHGFTEEVPNLGMGDLPGGIEDGWLAHFDYKTIGSEIHDHLFTVVLARAPKSVEFAKRVLCHDRDLSDIDRSNPEAGLELLKLEDRKFKLESDAFLDRYSVWADHDQDDLAAWQLFDPALIDWLTDQAPKDFSFELQNGALACFVPGAIAEADALDALCQGAARVLARVNEISGGSNAAPADEEDREQLVDHELAGHPFEHPPKSVFAASLHFGRIPLISRSSWQLGAEAFFRSHVAALGLERIEPDSFLAEHIDTVIPGAVTQVAEGRLPGTELDGYLLWTTDLDHRDVTWNVVLAPIAPEDNGYAFVDLPEADKADEDGYELNSDGGSISIFKPSGFPRRRNAEQLQEFLDRACPLLEQAVNAAKRR